VVAPDGSGNFRSLEEAVQQARPGAVIYLKAGIHRLKHPLVIDKPLTLIGEGMETTRIVCDGEECVVKFSGNGLFSVSDIAFVHEGARWGDAVQANMGEIRFYRCLFTGGVRDEANQRGGDGLWLYGTARGDVRECVALRNAGMGIRVSGKAQPTLEGNTCRENKRSGIAYFGSASGTARNNLCTANEFHGIEVNEQAQPTLEGNTCRENKRSGIAYFGKRKRDGSKQPLRRQRNPRHRGKRAGPARPGRQHLPGEQAGRHRLLRQRGRRGPRQPVCRQRLRGDLCGPHRPPCVDS
jgi:parallel beta-helix repeat protein